MFKRMRIHLIGIGGIGMSGIAEVLLALGYTVSGSDAKKTELTRRLTRKGAKIYYSHEASHVENADVLVASSAIKSSNPELLEARKRHLPILQRAEMLAELMRFSRYGIAVAGTHGKTTTTSIIASMLLSAKLDPTMIIGGKVNRLRTNARLGQGDYMVAEADESDGSFLKLSPAIAVITNIDREHMDHYGDLETLHQAFVQFAERVPFYGSIIACWDHPVVRDLFAKPDRRLVTYGLHAKAQYRAENVQFLPGGMGFELHTPDAKPQPIKLGILGEHNVQNALAAIAVGREIGLGYKVIKQALGQFDGVGRRCQVLYRSSSATVIDDYGHHPVEIRATLAAVRRGFEGRLCVVFQPHRYTRTQDLWDDLLTAFDAADEVWITEIYAAGEKPLPEVSGEFLAQALQKTSRARVHYLPADQTDATYLARQFESGDVWLTLGAGHITQLGHDLARTLKVGY